MRKLDRAMANSTMGGVFSVSEAILLPAGLSDHSLIPVMRLVDELRRKLESFTLYK